MMQEPILESDVALSPMLLATPSTTAAMALQDDEREFLTERVSTPPWIRRSRLLTTGRSAGACQTTSGRKMAEADRISRRLSASGVSASGDASATGSCRVESTSPPVTRRQEPAQPRSLLVPAGWALLLSIWVGLAAAIRAEEGNDTPSLDVAFSGWTAVLATAAGGLPLFLVRPEKIPKKMIGMANAAAAGMMLGAGFGMLHSLFEELDVTGGLVPAAGIAAGASIIAAVGRLGATAGSSNRVAMVLVAFSADAFAEGLALAAGSAGRGSVNVLVTAALVVHNVPEGLAVAAPLTLKEGCPMAPSAACLLAGLTSLPQPLVGLAAQQLLQAQIHPLIPCVLTATSVGAVVWVAVADLLVEAVASLGRPLAAAIVAPTTTLMLLYHALTAT